MKNLLKAASVLLVIASLSGCFWPGYYHGGHHGGGGGGGYGRHP